MPGPATEDEIFGLLPDVGESAQSAVHPGLEEEAVSLA